jgi:hypothetical protein
MRAFLQTLVVSVIASVATALILEARAQKQQTAPLPGPIAPGYDVT